MTNDRESHLEPNLGRLIKAAAGGEVQLGERARERTWQQLLAEADHPPLTSRFPRRVLGFLVGVQIFAVLWIGVRVFTSGIAGTFDLPTLFLALPAAVNLSWLPVVAALLIIQERIRHAQAA